MRAILRRIVVSGSVALCAAFVRTGAGQAAPAGLGTGLDQLVTATGSLLTGVVTNALGSLANCGYGPSSQVFLPFGDSTFYSLAPEGDIASTSGWSLRDVAVAADHDGYSGSAGSLVLTSGDSEALTPPMCVNLDNPTLRFFLAGQGSGGRLQVGVVYLGLDGQLHSLSLAQLAAGADWAPSPVIPIPLTINLRAVTSPGGATPIMLDFRAGGLQPGESFSIDGIYVDPRMEG